MQGLLKTIRKHLGMDVAFLSKFMHGRRVFRCVDSSCGNHPVKAGGSDLLEESYCQRIVDGRLPQLMVDASLNPVALELPVTTTLPVGAHISVPIKFSDGRIYGTFCCFSHEANHTLTERDLGVMYVFADLAARHIEQDVIADEKHSLIRQKIISVLREDSLTVVYQPIYNLTHNKIVGFESLSRFITTPICSPDVWFKEAFKVGLGVELEMKAVFTALRDLQQLPPEVYLSVNVSPETILSGAVAMAFRGMPLDRLVLEVTEHALIDRYEDIAMTLLPLRKAGLRVAVDDAGAGYASFRHILNLAPDTIKLDISLTRDIDSDESRRALTAALIGFAKETKRNIVAEGVETTTELRTLRQLGISDAQGYFLGRPMPLNQALQFWKLAPRIFL